VVDGEKGLAAGLWRCGGQDHAFVLGLEWAVGSEESLANQGFPVLVERGMAPGCFVV